jgi:hypothetical protein
MKPEYAAAPGAGNTERGLTTAKEGLHYGFERRNTRITSCRARCRQHKPGVPPGGALSCLGRQQHHKLLKCSSPWFAVVRFSSNRLCGRF